MMSIATSLAAVRRRVEAAEVRSGRAAGTVTLLPISKTVPTDRMREAIAAGLDRFGENRVQEAQGKASILADTPAKWTIVGHLQTNKAKTMLAFADEFQALDSLRLAEVLDRTLLVLGRDLDIYVQVNTSAEASKFGLEPEAVSGFLKGLPAFSTLRVRGLMTLAAFTPDEEVVRACFRRLKALSHRAEQQLGLPLELSMGMSGDYEAAIEEGATVIRVGQAIFGQRSTPDSFYWPDRNKTVG